MLALHNPNSRQHRLTIEMRTSLAGVDPVVVVRLGDIQRLAIGLATCLDGLHSEILRLEVTLGLNPADSAGVSEENLVSVQL